MVYSSFPIGLDQNSPGRPGCKDCELLLAILLNPSVVKCGNDQCSQPSFGEIRKIDVPESQAPKGAEFVVRDT